MAEDGLSCELRQLTLTLSPSLEAAYDKTDHIIAGPKNQIQNKQL